MPGMSRPAYLLLACMTLACASERNGTEPARDNPSEAKKEAPSVVQQPSEAPVGEPPSFEDGKVHVTDGPLPFTLALGDSGMSGDRSGDGDYLTLSGPPGGPLMLRIFPTTVGADVEKLIVGLRPEATPKPDRVTVLGVERPAVTWITGEGMSRTLWCGVIVAPADAVPGKPGLLLEFGVGRDEGDCKAARDHHVLGPVLDTLAFD